MVIIIKQICFLDFYFCDQWVWSMDYGHPMNAKNKETWNFGRIWQTQYASACLKNLILSHAVKAFSSLGVRSPWCGARSNSINHTYVLALFLRSRGLLNNYRMLHKYREHIIIKKLLNPNIVSLQPPGNAFHNMKPLSKSTALIPYTEGLLSLKHQ